MAGYLPLVAVDVDADAVRTYRSNFPDTQVLHADILGLTAFDLLEVAGLRRSDSLDLVIGGPPCTPFSKAGLWLDWKREGLDPAHGLIEVFGRFVAALRPRLFVFENVPTVASKSSPYRESYGRMLSSLRRAGYALDSAVLNAVDVGVPQARRRLFVVGALNSNGRGPKLTFRKVADSVSCRKAFADLPESPEPEEVLSGKWAELVAEVPPGENYLYFTKRRGYPSPLFEWRSRYWNFLLKLHPDRVSPTIQAQPGPSTGPFHWENRRLRTSELKRLFGYPDDFEFHGSRSSIQRQIGNSVPPPVGALIGSLLEAPDTALF